MLFIVYRTRHKGKPQSPQDVLARPSRGVVRFAQGPRDLYARGVMLARLLDMADLRTDLIPSIEHARIERLHEYVLIRGIEHFRRTAKARVNRWDQAWICCVSHEQCMGLMARAEDRQRAGRRLDWIESISVPSPLTQLRNTDKLIASNAAFRREFDDSDKDPSPFD